MGALGVWKDEAKHHQGGEEGLGGVKEVTGTTGEAGIGVTRVKIRWHSGTLLFYVVWFLKSHEL